MNEQKPYYIQVIKEDLTRRQRRSPSYSLRAYSRDLGIAAATLSLMFQGKRSLPLKKSYLIAEKLNLGPKERTYFFESLYKTKVKLDDIKIDPTDGRFMLDESYFSVIAEWEHYAVLTLFDCNDFVPTPNGAAIKLGISLMRAEVVFHNLVTSGLLKSSENIFHKTHQAVRTTEDVKSSALKMCHLETLELGKEKLDIEVELRDFSSIMLAMDPEKLPEAKTILREFRQKMASLLKNGNRTEVYQLAIQFYPLTKESKQETLS